MKTLKNINNLHLPDSCWIAANAENEIVGVIDMNAVSGYDAAKFEAYREKSRAELSSIGTLFSLRGDWLKHSETQLSERIKRVGWSSNKSEIRIPDEKTQDILKKIKSASYALRCYSNAPYIRTKTKYNLHLIAINQAILNFSEVAKFCGIEEQNCYVDGYSKRVKDQATWKKRATLDLGQLLVFESLVWKKV
jgi:uncharacterized protein YdhG (YjbR/CyaY superfamily)